MVEVIEEGVTGLLAEPGDTVSLAAALDILLSDASKREAFGKAGRERYIQHYTRDKLTDRTLDFYRQVIDRTVHGEIAGSAIRDTCKMVST
jgi:glycosyltransferase involved in cell wall biosynthesis